MTNTPNPARDDKFLLRLGRQPHDLDLSVLRRLLSGGDDEIADGASLYFSGPTDHRKGFKG